jgi:excisionase family DNA binding protein
VTRGQRTTSPDELGRSRPGLITIREAAQYLAVSVSTLYGWVYQRRVPFVKVGRALRFDRVDLDRFIETNRVRPRL